MIIILSLNIPDFKFPVSAALRLSLFIDDHGTDLFETAGIGNIIGLHPAEQGQIQKIRQFPDCAHGTGLFTFQFFTVLVQDIQRIFTGELHQPLFLSLFRNAEYDLL